MDDNSDRFGTVDDQETANDTTAQEQSAHTTRRQAIRRKFLIGAPFAVAAAFLAKQPEVAHAGTDGDWSLTGNAIDATKFLGTTNAQPLNMRTGNIQRMTINTAGNVGIGVFTPTAKLQVYGNTTFATRSDTISTAAGATGVFGRITATTGGTLSSGVRGEASSKTSVGGLFRNIAGAGTVGTGLRALSGSGSEADTSSFYDGAGEFSGPNGIVSAASTDSQNGYGIVALSRGTNGKGLYASVSASTGYTYGVDAYASSINGVGVRGSGQNSITNALNVVGVQGTATVGVQGQGEYMGVQGSSPNYGIFGYCTPDTQGIGAYGRGAIGVKGRSYTGTAVLGDTDSGIGVQGESYSDGGSVKAIYGLAYGANSNGVVGEANNGTSAYGIWGRSTSGYAGVFSGKVTVTGTLSKGGGSFKIDHPLDPANKYLYHSFVESPDMMNIYNGNVNLDAHGEAIVQLPAWFTALNRDYRYQLTPIGAPGPNLFIASEVKSNEFKIAGGTANGRVSWQVTGIRQDAFANTNRIPVEEEKPADERGTYLHAEAFGKSAKLSVDNARVQSLQAHRMSRVPDPHPPINTGTPANAPQVPLPDKK